MKCNFLQCERFREISKASNEDCEKMCAAFFSEVDELCVRGSRTVVHEENITNKRMGPTPTAENVFATSPQRASLFTELAACGNFDWQL